MGIRQNLEATLASIAERQERLVFWCSLARSWAAAALLGLVLVVIRHQTGWSSWMFLPVIILAALILVAWTLPSESPANSDWSEVARRIEAKFPELDGRLLTAVQQAPTAGRSLNYLQERLLLEALQHNQANDWSRAVSNERLKLAQSLHWGSLVFLCFVLFQLRVTDDRQLFVADADSAVTVTPGDTKLERGSTLVVLARFSGPLPVTVDLVMSGATQAVHVPLVKSLADPLFGGTVPEVASNFTYRVNYAGHSTRDFQVQVFDFPRLQRADADVAYPAYTGEAPRHIADTRRLSAAEGSILDLTLQLNKPVVSARLVGRSKDHPVLALAIETNQPVAVLRQFLLDSNQVYDLQLLDDDGRTNKVPAQFVLEALKNRPPEIRLATPRGDLRPSPLEEVTFEGSVWDDFGVAEYGLGYSVAGRPIQLESLGKEVPGKQKRQFQFVLHLEDLHVKPDELVSWFVWADDLGPDGNVRRTMGDLFFGEIRAFDEVFREGQGMAGQGQGEQSGGGGQTARLTELQKQIISATWNLQRRQERAPGTSTGTERKARVTPGPESRNIPARGSNGFGLASPRIPPLIFGQPVSAESPPPLPTNSSTGEGEHSTRTPARQGSGSSTDVDVIRDSQAQALEQATAAAERARDPRSQGLWTAALREMDQALDRLRRATNSTTTLAEALAAEQAAYQALLRLQEHEYQVTRQRNRSQSGSAGQQQMQRQLEQMELTQSEDRYENQRQAQAPQSSQRREQLQIMNRLQELARRQSDLNERLKELQTALQEARTEEQRAELQRRLKRLQEEEQQMLADVDELRQRMDRPENQSRLADERRQLDQTREDIQRAGEAAQQGSASQALASGTRAERQIQQLRDQLRKENSSEFAEDLRSMRAQARELAQRQQEIQKSMQEDPASARKSLSEPSGHDAVLTQLSRQKELLTNLVERATQMSQQAESSEPLLANELYDAVRKFSQDSAKNVREIQDALLGRGLMPGSLMDTLKSGAEPDGAKLLDVATEMLSRDFVPQASHAGQRAGERMEDLKRGVERAAESVLGDDAEALRLAQQELDQLTQQLQSEMAQAEPGEVQTNRASATGSQAATDSAASQRGEAQSRSGQQQRSAQAGSRSQRPEAGSQPGEGADSEGAASSQDGQPNGQQADRSSRPGNQAGTSGGASDRGAEQARSGIQPRTSANRDGTRQAGGNWSDSGASAGGGGGPWNFDRFLNDQAWRRFGPITGEDFRPWSDRLREVEEMIEAPDLRNEVAAARERARLLRQDFKQNRKKPDWAVVRTQVMSPLTQVRDRIAEELARRQSGEALVPIDRDPVPTRYSDLVRRYYEELGKDK